MSSSRSPALVNPGTIQPRQSAYAWVAKVTRAWVRLIALVEEGIIAPTRRDETDYRFSGHSLRRGIKAIRLQRDLNLNLAGVALALDLLEENRMLRARLRIYEK